jgi:hypothetical protein
MLIESFLGENWPIFTAVFIFHIILSILSIVFLKNFKFKKEELKKRYILILLVVPFYGIVYAKGKMLPEDLSLFQGEHGGGDVGGDSSFGGD